MRLFQNTRKVHKEYVRYFSASQTHLRQRRETHSQSQRWLMIRQHYAPLAVLQKRYHAGRRQPQYNPLNKYNWIKPNDYNRVSDDGKPERSSARSHRYVYLCWFIGAFCFPYPHPLDIASWQKLMATGFRMFFVEYIVLSEISIISKKFIICLQK